MVNDTNCQSDEIQRVLKFSIVIGTSPSNSKTDLMLYAYDAVMGVALAINETIKEEKSLQHKNVLDELRTLTFSGYSVSTNSMIESSISTLWAIPYNFYNNIIAHLLLQGEISWQDASDRDNSSITLLLQLLDTNGNGSTS